MLQINRLFSIWHGPPQALPHKPCHSVQGGSIICLPPPPSPCTIASFHNYVLRKKPTNMSLIRYFAEKLKLIPNFNVWKIASTPPKKETKIIRSEKELLYLKINRTQRRKTLFFPPKEQGMQIWNLKTMRNNNATIQKFGEPLLLSLLFRCLGKNTYIICI